MIITNCRYYMKLKKGFFCDNDGNFLSFIPSPFTAKGMYHFTTVSSILYQIKVTFRFFCYLGIFYQSF